LDPTCAEFGSVRIECPTGFVLTGGGYEASFDVRVMDNYSPEPTAWLIRGYNTSLVEGGRITAHAKCFDFTP
jgi:hypothetical protein